MGVTTTQHIRKPLYVDAVRITGANFDEIATWCQGEVLQDEVPGKGTGKRYIKVRVHNPLNPRQTKAFVGDWLLYTERGYKVYTNKAFHAAFDEVVALEHEAAPSYPYGEGDTLVLGPECFVSQDGEMLCWKGVNYVQQSDGIVMGNDEIAPGITLNEGIKALREGVALEELRGEGLVGPEPEEIEIVPATAENIAQAVRENEAARSKEENEHSDSETKAA